MIKTIKTIAWLPVASRVRSDVYFVDKRLFVRFKDSGEVYCYRNVDRKLFQEMLRSPSIGSYFNKKIKPFFPVEKITF